jgi:hypothetical protein
VLVLEVLEHLGEEYTVLLIVEQPTMRFPSEFVAYLGSSIVLVDILASLFEFVVVLVLHDVEELHQRYLLGFQSGLLQIVVEVFD